MRHILLLEHALCRLSAPIGNAVHVLFDNEDVDCPDCLQRVIAEAEARTQALRDQLAKIEALS